MLRIIPVILLMVSPLAAQTNTGLLTDPWADGQSLQLRADVWTQSSGVADTAPGAGDDDLDITTTRTRTRVRLAPTPALAFVTDAEFANPDPAIADPEPSRPSLVAALGIETTRVDFSSSSDPRVPSRLVREEFALGLPLNSSPGGDIAFGTTLGLGHASTQPWADANAPYVLASVFGQTTLDGGSTLLLGVSYDGNRSTLPDTPLPILEYRIPLNETAGAGREIGFTLGYPDARITYRHNEKLTASLGFDNLDFATAQVRYDFTESFALQAQYAAFYDMFHAPRISADRRLFYISQRLEAGAILTPRPGLELLLSGGTTFGQQLRTGYDWRRTQQVVEFDDAVFLRLGVNLTF